MTAIDTNVLLDILVPGAPHAKQSTERLEACQDEGAAIISEIVFAELSSRFPSARAFDAFLDEARIQVVPSSRAALHEAGIVWLKHVRNRRKSDVLCHACGSKQIARCARCDAAVVIRQHIIADFLIGAHATVHANRLLSRDRGFYAKCFASLQLVAPSR